MAEDYGAFVDSPVASDTGYARMQRRYTTDGVVQDGPDAGDQLTVTGDATSQITIAPGYAQVGGWFYRTDTSVTVDVPPNGASSRRRDLVVIRADTGEDSCYPYIIEGTPGGSWPTPTRDPSGVWDTVLSRHTVQGGSSVVTSGDVDTSVREWTVPSGAIPCDSAARPASPFEGMLISETDTGRVLVRLDGSWRTVADTEYPTSWQPISLRDGYSTPNHGPSPSWRWVARGEVELRGTIQRNSGAIPSGAFIATVPSAAVPPHLRRHVGAANLVSGGYSVRLDVTSPHSSTWAAGRIVPYRLSAYQPSWVALDGWRYTV